MTDVEHEKLVLSHFKLSHEKKPHQHLIVMQTPTTTKAVDVIKKESALHSSKNAMFLKLPNRKIQ